MNDKIFINKSARIFTVKLMWDIGQPFVCGTLEEVVKYALKPNNGIEYFAELTGSSFKRISKKDLKELMNRASLQDLSKQLFRKY